MEHKLSALYYPFSRSIRPGSTKQLLLVFDSVHYLDPVDDEDWRAKLLSDLEESHDPRFSTYRDVHAAIPALIQEGAVVREDPKSISALSSQEAAASAVSDLLDPRWVTLASNPGSYGMPFESERQGQATWQAFPDKMPTGFLDALSRDKNLRGHLVRAESSRHVAWALTYAAGSAGALNTHLAAAAELSLSPVTDSPLHHELLLHKLARRTPSNGVNSEAPSNAGPLVSHLTSMTAVRLLESVLPPESLQGIAFDDVLRFRQETASARQDLVAELHSRLSAVVSSESPGSWLRSAQEVGRDLRAALREYRGAMISARGKLWPSLISSLTATVPAGSVAALAMSYIGGAANVLQVSIAAAALAILKAQIESRAEQKITDATADPGVAYLSLVNDKFG